MTKIIIVDDSQTELEVFANALRTEGFEVFKALSFNQVEGDLMFKAAN